MQVAVIHDVTGTMLAQMLIDASTRPADVRLSSWALDKAHQFEEDSAEREFWRDVFRYAREHGQ